MNRLTTAVVAIISAGFLIAIVILFANFMVKHDGNSTYNVDKDAKAICKELHAEFRKVGHDRFCIRDGKTVWP